MWKPEVSKIECGLKIVKILATANDNAKENNASKDRFGRRSIITAFSDWILLALQVVYSLNRDRSISRNDFPYKAASTDLNILIQDLEGAGGRE